MDTALSANLQTYLRAAGICMDGMHSKIESIFAGKQSGPPQEGTDPIKIKISWSKGVYDEKKINFALFVNKVEGVKREVLFSIEITGENKVTVRLPKGAKSGLRQIIADSLKGVEITWKENVNFSES